MGGGALEKMLTSGRSYLIGALLVAAVAVVYWNGLDADFLVHHDDDDYVTGNPNVMKGLGIESAAWAFTHAHACNWHPLTWISHQWDVTRYGLDPRGHHLTSLILHGLNTLLLFLVISRMTGAVWRSAFAAALFGIHPLHVESAAWIAERKDVLSTLFMMLAIWAYIGYSRRPHPARYLLVVLLFILGLLSKPMVVTLPFVLLLLDYWPLKRMVFAKHPPGKDENSSKKECPAFPPKRPAWLVLEKTPLFALSAASCAVTLIVQKEGGAVQGFPLLTRISNALVAYVEYILKTIWPSRLSALYPHPEESIPLWQAAAAAAFLIAATGLVFYFGRRFRPSGRRFPYLLVGWLWFIGTLVPVIGLVQVGNQAMADRYTYIPLIGLFLIAAWGIRDLFRQRAGTLIALAAVCALAATARVQVGRWKDSPTLFRHALYVTENNYLAEHDLGMALILTGKPEEGVEHLRSAVRIKPGWGVAYVNLAMVQHCLGNHAEAWKYVHLGRKHGFEPDARFLNDLSKEMKDPGE